MSNVLRVLGFPNEPKGDNGGVSVNEFHRAPYIACGDEVSGAEAL